jgi:hypothetical protein
MDPTAATGDAPAKEPHLPPMHEAGDLAAPTAPTKAGVGALTQPCAPQRM